jgi:hypothetical protein
MLICIVNGYGYLRTMKDGGKMKSGENTCLMQLFVEKILA